MKVTLLFSCCNTINKNAISDSVIEGEKCICVAILLMVCKHEHNGVAVLLQLELAQPCLVTWFLLLGKRRGCKTVVKEWRDNGQLG